jgi:hypothetical protein
MTILFFPLGASFSSSFATKASITATIPIAGFPQTASLAEYISNYIGPVGPVYKTISGNDVTLA